MPGRKAPKTERREQILKAAMRVAVTNRLAAVTIRDVATEAGLSTGLVLFHFKSRDRLVRALLDWMLHQNLLLQPDVSRRERGDDCLTDLIRDECKRLVANRHRTELFFDYWVAGTKRPALRTEMRTALRLYRQQFHTLATKMLKARGGCSAIDAGAVSAAAVSFINGCAMQAVIDPEQFDIDAALAVIDALADHGKMAHSARVGARSKRARRA